MDDEQEEEVTQRDDDVDNGWKEVRYRKRAKEGRQHIRASPSPTRTPRRHGAQLISKINRASRMPRLPTGHYKIVIRPRGGLQISQLSLTELDKALYEAAEIRYEERDMDTICPNNFQNILVVSTPNQEHADKYQGIKHIKANDKVFEVRAYETAPEITATGVIRGVPLEETPRDITAAVITPRNPTAIAAKRLGNTTTVIDLFDGYRAATAGRASPHHRADRSRQIQIQEEGNAWVQIPIWVPHDAKRSHPAVYRTEPEGRPDSIALQIPVQRPRGCHGHRGDPPLAVSWSDAVKGTRPRSSGETAHNINEIAEIKRENAQLRELISQLTREIQSLKSCTERTASQTRSAGLERPEEIPDNRMKEDSTPPPLKRKAQASSDKTATQNSNLNQTLSDIQKAVKEQAETTNNLSLAMSMMMNRLDKLEANVAVSTLRHLRRLQPGDQHRGQFTITAGHHNSGCPN
ncbi:hypothetical protein HPB49_004116 [Dermacentor silvarum]|uniref:Uncharacterized protein n=1 Tax=Dermacentor silvarum TaxID=543639 RepID=A0ACB8DTN4_DERSI|nr:hypothetical protein HPB49_004116 [Dermacentor silvarum]